ncbi:LamG domain-containing protein [Aquiflexum sp.]|uniref:LamG domain-containing protein n=1 Tax=Aquiflexum sp. TaxID=1872584 RepID=UPI003593191E
MKKHRFYFILKPLISLLLLPIFLSCKKDDPTPAPQIPVLATLAVGNISTNTASSGGNITSDGGSAITARGVCWSTTQSPTIADNKTADGTGTGNFTSDIIGLSSGTQYYVRAYATNSLGTAYGQDLIFTTISSTMLDGLLSYWKLDETTGTIADDAAGTWDLSFQANPVWTTSGKIKNAIDFGNTSIKYLEKSGIRSGNKNTYSLSAWIYLQNDLPSPKYIMGINSGVYASSAGASEVKLMITPDNKFEAMYYTVDGATSVMNRVSGTVIALNTWYHVVGVINNGNIELYINGVADNTNTVSNPVNSILSFTDGRATVGHARFWEGAYNSGRWFRGKIDEAAIWDRALTSDEISALYNNGNGLQHPF